MAVLSDQERRRVSGIFANLNRKKRLESGEVVTLEIGDLEWLCIKAIDGLSRDSMLLSFEAPIVVLGDIHGQFNDMMHFIERGGSLSSTTYLFLGDYVDRGPNSIEVISFLLCAKLLWPDRVFLLRGNHETLDISKLYGFLSECESRYSRHIWVRFNEVFKYLPLAAIIGNRIFCVHGGISPNLDNIQRINSVVRPLEVSCAMTDSENGFVMDLLWADPDRYHSGFNYSERGTSYTFGSDVTDEFLDKNDFDLICRAHQVVRDGFEFPFHPDQTVLTIFSASNYCGDYGNKAAMLKIDSSLTCAFETLTPENYGADGGDLPDIPYVNSIL
jgi:serine/threonine-protein phosphatase PP1 catalytic subunit